MSTPGLPLPDWLRRLETLSPREIDLGLERVAEVLGRMQLEPPARVIIVGGTNGKGSSVEMLRALLAGSGVIGTYTSPHVIRYNERIAIDGRPAADEEIVAAFERVEAARDEVPLTYFEFGTLAALAVFDAAGVTTAILEVGLGGRLDAVNVVEPDASLITNVSLDHCEWLGERRREHRIREGGHHARRETGCFRQQRHPGFGGGPCAEGRRAACPRRA